MEEVLNYFAQFRYAPTKEEIVKFYPKKVNPRKIQITNNKFTKETKKRNEISKNKEESVQHFIQFAAKIPWLLLLGYSGSVAMRNADEAADIDFFVITKAHWLWTTRFFLILLTIMLGKKRWPGQNKAPNTICLNLFFDEQDMAVPTKRRSLFTAHEVLQMRSVVNKQQAYERFLWANRWVKKYFPNSRMGEPMRSPFRGQTHGSVRTVEFFLKMLQLIIMRKRTNEVITDTQLWFIPRDVGESFQPHDR